MITSNFRDERVDAIYAIIPNNNHLTGMVDNMSEGSFSVYGLYRAAEEAKSSADYVTYRYLENSKFIYKISAGWIRQEVTDYGT